MSKKIETIKMKQDKKGLVPSLRFSEFSNDGDWEKLPLSDVYSFKVTNSFSRDKLNYEKGSVKNIHYGDIHTKFSTLFDITQESVPFINPNQEISNIKTDNYCIEGDIIFADASEDMNDIGKSMEIVNLNNEKLLSGLHTLLARQKKNRLKIGFGGYLFKSKGVRSQVQKEAQGAKVLGISATRLSNIKIAFPLNKKEQQKIADCLSSIDELITAESEKLEAIKNHKKGLMQNLFPSEGKTTPNFRFPEFENSAEWEERALNQITTSIFDGTHQTPKYTEDGIPFFSVENIISGKMNKFISKDDHLVATSKNKPEKGDLLITRIGNIGFSTIIDWDYEFSIYVTLAVIKKDNRFNSSYLHSYLQSEQFQTEIRSKSLINAVPCKINMDELRKTKVLLPKPKEQQKIADCFSCLDDLITSQTQKIEVLKIHKKGLMQQLFPNIDQTNQPK
jgi:type I restriction enzyme S subunit